MFLLGGMGVLALILCSPTDRAGAGGAPAHAAVAAPEAAVPGRLPPSPVPPAAPTPPTQPSVPGVATSDVPEVTIQIGGKKPSTSIVILIALTVMSIAPAALLLCTSFTKVFVTLSITRNAMGLTTVPPNQVIAGLALFITIFIMSPVFTETNNLGIQPYLKGEKSQSVAFRDGTEPLRTFMLDHSRKEEIALFTKVAGDQQPKNRDSVPLTTLIPAFALSELRTALVIGFIIYVPFLVIDMVVSAALMSMGMMMLPPVTVSLPFKLLLFVLVDGWGLIVTALVASYR